MWMAIYGCQFCRHMYEYVYVNPESIVSMAVCPECGAVNVITKSRMYPEGCLWIDKEWGEKRKNKSRK